MLKEKSPFTIGVLSCKICNGFNSAVTERDTDDDILSVGASVPVAGFSAGRTELLGGRKSFVLVFIFDDRAPLVKFENVERGDPGGWQHGPVVVHLFGAVSNIFNAKYRVELSTDHPPTWKHNSHALGICELHSGAFAIHTSRWT
ncbi:uncharacterized protein LOC144718643 isoform X2 [Lampetra planeri]